MGNIRSVVFRPFKNFNIESRAHRELERQQVKPVRAPKYQQDSNTQGQVLVSHDIVKEKDDLLHERLKVVRVESTGPANQQFGSQSHKLPGRTTAVPEPEYGVVEPTSIPPGRITISQALNLISQHQTDPTLYSASHIAREYKLELYSAQQVLKYFQVFHMHIPQKMQERFPHLLTTLKSQISRLESEKQKKLLNFAREAAKPDKNKVLDENIEKQS